MKYGVAIKSKEAKVYVTFEIEFKTLREAKEYAIRFKDSGVDAYTYKREGIKITKKYPI